jgi:hypothetical protein
MVWNSKIKNKKPIPKNKILQKNKTPQIKISPK